jgi:hypothetical protein
MANFSTDLDEAESRDVASKSFNRVEEFRPKDGETYYLRIIVNKAIPVDVHRFIHEGQAGRLQVDEVARGHVGRLPPRQGLPADR